MEESQPSQQNDGSTIMIVKTITNVVTNTIMIIDTIIVLYLELNKSLKNI
jgi:hypothetical protein